MAPPSNPVLSDSRVEVTNNASKSAKVAAVQTTSTSTGSGSEEDLKHVIDERKQRRMLSNRESARRSRMRKQQHLDELRAEAAHLRAENNHMLTKLNMASQKFLQIEDENAKMRTYASDLNTKLQSLNMVLQWAGLLNELDCSSSPEYDYDIIDPNSCLLNPFDHKQSYFSHLPTATEIYQ